MMMSFMLELKKIKILPQMRSRINSKELDRLILSITSQGQLADVLVAEYNKQLWKELSKLKGVSIESLSKYRYVMIAGHKRYRAIKSIGDECIRAKILKNISVQDFIVKQMAENVYAAPSPTDTATSVSECYEIAKGINSKLTLRQFSKDIGKCEETVRSYLRYVRLPDMINDWVEKKVLGYKEAVVLAVLIDINQDVLEKFALDAMRHNWKAKKLKIVIKNYLEDQERGQESIFTIHEEKLIEEQSQNVSVTSQTINAFYAAMSGLIRIKRLHEEKILNKNISPFKSKSSVNVFLKTINITEKLLPMLKEQLKEDDIKTAQGVIDEAKSISLELVEQS